jgi:hypothetical protein
MGRNGEPVMRNFDLDAPHRAALRRRTIFVTEGRQPHFAGDRIAQRCPPSVEPCFKPVVAARFVKDQHVTIARHRPTARAVDPVDLGDCPDFSRVHPANMPNAGESESLQYRPNLWLNRTFSFWVANQWTD